MKIREMNIEDLDQVYGTGKDEDGFAVSSKSSFYPKDILANWIISEQDTMLVAEESRKITGYIMSMGNVYNQSAIITNIYVDPKHRRKGLGKQLIQECLRHLKKRNIRYVYAQVKLTNDATIKFFQLLGFHVGYDFTWMEIGTDK